MKRMAVMASDKNVYYRVGVLWPELLFVMMALNDFVSRYAEKKTKRSYYSLSHKDIIWDRTVAATRTFQAAVADCIREAVPATSLSRVMNLLHSDYAETDRFTWQYIDVLNCQFLQMDSEKRLKNISVMAKRLRERGDDYRQLTSEVQAATRAHGVDTDRIKPPVDYPDDFEW